MGYPEFDRRLLRIRPLGDRINRTRIEQSHVTPEAPPRPQPPEVERVIAETIERITHARHEGRPVVLAFGAHTIKNGLAPVLIRLIEQGWVTQLATNGAGIIHDWEFAFQGASAEHVAENVSRGQFGLWQETGFFINLALIVGAFEGLGYGESVGALIERDGLQLPAPDELRELVRTEGGGDLSRAAAAADLLQAIREFGLEPGWMKVPHPYQAFSVQAASYRQRIPLTGHPMFGHDIIYTHPMSHGAAIGRAAQRDFLIFARAVSQLEGGVYLSVGSAVMSPMVFEKALSMAQNVSLQRGAPISRHFMVIVDLARSGWDWLKDGEPPQDHPAYYLRFCKTFSRMGGTMRYVSADNRDFLLALCQGLGEAR
ncbi:MAG: hypothetical protein HY906_13900 [Deltaproteobacteria bacterium]|nr:hypothetical protein [Deltaproteobacteria bacterium]